MKLFAATLILLIVPGAWGQGGKKPSGPESVGVFHYLDSSNQIVPLESQVIRLQHKYHALGFAGGTTVYLLKGEKSPIRLQAGSKTELVAQLEGDLDPLETVQFYRFNGENNSRVVPISEFDLFGRLSKAILSTNTIDFNAVKQGDSSFKLITIQALAPGEYCLMVKSINQWPEKIPGYCFGVDASGRKETQ